VAYTINSAIPNTIKTRETELLRSGFSYRHIAELTGERRATIKERNRLVYHIDIYEAFKKRIDREGIPNNLNITDGFGYYFSGFFDGEGHLVTFYRVRQARGKQVSEFRLALQIAIRNDDLQVLQYIQDNLGGNIRNNIVPKRGNPVCKWFFENIKQLTETIIPLFDRYPLRTKKAREYEIWRNLVIERYVATLGGETQRGGYISDTASFERGVKAIQTIRKYKNPAAT
jgi:hypothetical protein